MDRNFLEDTLSPISEDAVSNAPQLETITEKSNAIRYLEHGATSDLIRWHCHNEIEVHLIVNTNGKCFVGDYVGNFSPGQIVITGPNLPHNWISDPNTICEASKIIRDKVINFELELFEKTSMLIPEMSEMVGLLKETAYGIEFSNLSVQKYTNLFNRVRDTTGMSRFTGFLNLIDNLRREPSKRQLSTTKCMGVDDQPSLRIISEAIDFITKNYDKKIQLEDVSKHVGVSPTRLSRYFYENTGSKYIEFLTKVRISKACEALEHTNDQITKICFDSGFTNVSNFNRHFLKIKSMTPKEYREAIRLRSYLPDNFHGGH